MILIYIVIILFALYSLLVLYYGRTWQKIPNFAPVTSSTLRVTVIIPARNEEENIGRLLQALAEQTYDPSLVEIIVVDDHSTDQTATIVRQFTNVKLIQLADDNINSYKKKAIATAIEASTGELIITTDADCLPPADWLRTITSFREEKKAILVVAPVVISCNASVLQMFQAMDFMVLQGITGAAVHTNHLSMCNGANLAYEKKAFYEVGGFDGIDAIASGDDMLLMYKIAKKHPGRIHFLKSKDAIVSTQPVRSWKEFFSQRIRWASKAAKYDDKRIFAVLLLVYLFNLSFLVLAVAGFWNFQYWLILLIGWALKTIVELPLFWSVALFFDKRWAIRLFFFFQLLHIIYTIVSGLFGQFGKYEWKGRRVN